MKRAMLIVVLSIGVALVGFAALHLKYGGYATGVVQDAMHRAKQPMDGRTIELDTCRYSLQIPADIDHPETSHFDTTIARSNGCMTHMLYFPPQGTETEYTLHMDSVTRDLHFTFDEVKKQWLDITDLPAGDYNVSLLACGNGGGFTLRIK